MNVRWTATRDYRLVARLHRQWNPTLYETLYRYDGLRYSDFHRPEVRCWITRGHTRTQGYAVAVRRRDELVFEELWAETTGVPSPRLSLPLPDRNLLDTTKDMIERAGSRHPHVTVRFPSDNPLGNLLARSFHWPLVSTLLLSTGEPRMLPKSRLGPGLSVRPYRAGDETDYARIHQACFGEKMNPASYRSWIVGKHCHAFTAMVDGRTVGLIVSEPRRGGITGDFNLAVEEEARNLGLGTALMTEGIRAFHRRGIPRVVIDHWATNGRAVQFYKRFGFRVERAYHFFRVR